MSFINDKPKNRKPKNEVSPCSVVKKEKPVAPFNFGGSSKPSIQNKRGNGGGLQATGGAFFV